MLIAYFTELIASVLAIFISIPFGSLSITLGSILYVPTGSKTGKYLIIIGLIILSLHSYVF
ncbi:MAG: hypothetical protein ACXACP_08665 [Candidatus Hodarchaeales archaeon]